MLFLKPTPRLINNLGANDVTYICRLSNFNIHKFLKYHGIQISQSKLIDLVRNSGKYFMQNVRSQKYDDVTLFMVFNNFFSVFIL